MNFRTETRLQKLKNNLQLNLGKYTYRFNTVAIPTFKPFMFLVLKSNKLICFLC